MTKNRQGSNGFFGTRIKKPANWTERTPSKRGGGNTETDWPNHLARMEDRNLQGFVDIVEPTDTCLVSAEKKIRDEDVKKLQNEATAEKKVTFAQDYNEGREPSHGSGDWTSRNDDDKPRRSLAHDKQVSCNGAMMSTPQPDTREKLRPSNQSYNTFSRNRLFERGNYPNNNSNRYNDYRTRSPYQSDRGQCRNWGSNNSYSQSPSTSRQDSTFTDFRRQSRSNSPNHSVFNRFGNQDSSKDIHYNKRFPTSKNGKKPNLVRFTTTDDSILELSGLNQITSILNHYWEPSPDKAIKFDSFYSIVILFIIFIFYATLFSIEVIAVTWLQTSLTQIVFNGYRPPTLNDYSNAPTYF